MGISVCLYSTEMYFLIISLTIGYMDVPWLQRNHLVYMGVVHCGDAMPFKRPRTMVQLLLFDSLLMVYVARFQFFFD